MSNNFPENPYRRPSMYIHPKKLVEVSQVGQEIADKLQNGDASPLPTDLLDFLEVQTEAINLNALADARLKIANQIPTPPYIPGEVIRVGNLLAGFLQATAEVAIHMEMDDAAITALWRPQ